MSSTLNFFHGNGKRRRRRQRQNSSLATVATRCACYINYCPICRIREEDVKAGMEEQDTQR